MRYLRRQRKTALYELLCREYGVPCPAWTSMQAFRYTAFGPRRRWVKIFQTRQSSLLELSGDLLWLTVTDQRNVPPHNVMKRILGDGRLMTMYTTDLFPRLKETEIYEIPDPVYRSCIPQREYQPVLIGLRKGGVLTRHNLDTGQLYDRVGLGLAPTSSFAVNYVADNLVVKSQRLSNPDSSEIFYRFQVFQLHPFKYLTTFDVDSAVFPSPQHRKEFGKLRNAEIHDGLLLVMTEKSFNLVYDAEHIIQECVAKQKKVKEHLEPHPINKITVTPPLLFYTFAHLDILGLGACPWTYIRGVTDSVMEVRDMGSGELLGNGRVSWGDGGDQIAPDFLMFHPDDSSRVIHMRTQELRVLGIHSKGGKRVLEEEFTYPEKRVCSTEAEVTYSRSGRRTKPLFKLDNSLNRLLSFNVETDMRVLVMLEAWLDEVQGSPHMPSRLVNKGREQKVHSIRLEKLMFYDSFTYELLHQMEIGERVEGDENNRLSVSIDRDIVNIVSHKGTQHTVLVFRLKEDFTIKEEEKNETEVESKRGKSQESRRSNKNTARTRKRSRGFESDDEWDGDDSPERRAARRKRRKRQVNRQVKRTERPTRESVTSESDEGDEWTP